MQFYDVHEQTKYQITVSRPETVDQLSDLFITEEELQSIVGRNFHFYGNDKRTFKLNEVISAELKEWAAKLDASGKKTLVIEDEELVELLKDHHYGIPDFMDGDNTYGRHGNRICYAKRYKRKKTKPTKTDVHYMWSYLQAAFRDKYGVYPSHIPRYDRCATMFKAFKDIVGWRRVRKQMYQPTAEDVRFYRQIWDNPEEFV